MTYDQSSVEQWHCGDTSDTGHVTSVQLVTDNNYGTPVGKIIQGVLET